MPPTEFLAMPDSWSGDAVVGPASSASTVVRVRGEHDLATSAHLTATISRAASSNDGDIVVDLGDLTFMDASTIGVLVCARNRLRESSRSLSVRAPSPLARRLLDVCSLACLIDERRVPVEPTVAPALGSWVDVPASTHRSDTAPTAERSTLERRVEPAESPPLPRAPS